YIVPHRLHRLIDTLADVTHAALELANALADGAANLGDALAPEDHQADQQQHQQFFRTQFEHDSLRSRLSCIVRALPAGRDPQLLKYPIAYMTEAGFWTMTDREAAGMRAYLLKGGFIIFDDFRDDFRSAGWANFETNMRRSLPDVRFVDLDPSHPIFHSFFDID